MTTTAEKTSGSSKRVVRGLWSGAALLGLSFVLLTLSFPSWLPRGLAWLVMLGALVPWGMCIVRRTMGWKQILLYYGFGVAWFLGNLYWLVGITVGGMVALCFYCGLWFMFAAWGTHRVMHHLRMPATVAMPLMWVACEYLRSTLFTGFAWFLVGNPMAGNPVILQAADIFGVWGLSFFVMMTNGFIVDMLRLPLYKKGKVNPRIVRLCTLYGTVLAVVILYGIFRLMERTQGEGPLVAVVQVNIPQGVKDEGMNGMEILEKHIALTEEAAVLHPDVIVWPETMLPRQVNQEWLSQDILDWPDYAKHPDFWPKYHLESIKIDRIVSQTARDAGSALLVGSGGLLQRGKEVVRENLAILYTADGRQEPTHYAKRHLVPFGEYVPLQEAWPWLGGVLSSLAPEGFESLVPGPNWAVTKLHTKSGKDFRIGTPICYEDVMPDPCLGFVDPSRAGKRTDVLIALINDGWYRSGHQLDQHLQMAQVRAVETRTPMARSVNGGDSGFIDSNGKVLGLVTNGETPHFVSGILQMRMMKDSRISLFSRIGNLFGVLCGVGAALAVAWTIVRPRRRSSEALTIAG